MTTPLPHASELLEPPEPERSSPRAAEESLRELEAPAAGAGPPPPGAPPGGAPAAGGARSHKRKRGRPRKYPRPEAPAPSGGHKPTKAELEDVARQQAARILELETMAAPDAAAAVAQLANNLEKLVHPLVRLMVSWRGPHWQLTPQEQREIADGWAPYLLPKVSQLAEHTPLVMALTVTGLALAKPLTAEFEMLTGPTPAGELVMEPEPAPGPIGL